MLHSRFQLKLKRRLILNISIYGSILNITDSWISGRMWIYFPAVCGAQVPVFRAWDEPVFKITLMSHWPLTLSLFMLQGHTLVFFNYFYTQIICLALCRISSCIDRKETKKTLSNIEHWTQMHAHTQMTCFPQTVWIVSVVYLAMIYLNTPIMCLAAWVISPCIDRERAVKHGLG